MLNQISIKTILTFTLFYFLISFSSSVPSLTLNETITGEMKRHELFEYFTLTISKNLTENKYILVFIVKEDKKNILEREEVFSDPDIYVSKKDKQLHCPETSDYYSERYGNDILSIPSSEVNPNDIFYIG